MRDTGIATLQDTALYFTAAIVAVVVIVAISEWLRERRQRDIYAQTRRNASKTIMMQQQRKRNAGQVANDRA